MLEDDVLPFLEHRRRRIPEKWELEDEDVVSGQQLLFPMGQDVELGVGLVKVVKRYPWKRVRGGGQAAVDTGFFEGWMGEENQQPLRANVVHSSNIILRRSTVISGSGPRLGSGHYL